MLTRRSHLSCSGLVEKPPEVCSRKWLIHQLDMQTSRAVRRWDERRASAARGGTYSARASTPGAIVIRYDLRNCSAVCAGCNRLYCRDPRPYLAYMRAHYGPAVVTELARLRPSLWKMSDEELQCLLEEYGG